MENVNLTFVQITQDVFFACVSHALTTEKEEIMGLLIGNIEVIGEKRVAKVWDINMLTRIDKRKDRVEISSEQLVNATMEAEKLTKQGIPTRVIGWYHSHPHISPWPSHVDLNCQGNYQQMEPGFIGLIFSVYNEEPDNKGKVELHAFQTKKVTIENFEKYNQVPIPCQITSNLNFPEIALNRMIKLIEIMYDEEKHQFHSASGELVDVNSNLFQDIHNRSIYTKNLTKLLELYAVPLKRMMEKEIEENHVK